MALSLTINGEVFASRRDPMTPLVDVLREDLALTGAKAVCREGFCGACLVLLDGRPAASCLTPIALAQGAISAPSRASVPTASRRRCNRRLKRKTSCNAACAFPAWW